MTTLRRSVLLALLLASSPLVAQSATPVEVFKNPYCGCCEKWMTYLKQSGFKVAFRNVDDVSAVRKSLGMPDRYASCHTAKVGKYIIEGHVPAADIRRLLKEKPQAVGLAVPSMPPWFTGNGRPAHDPV